VGYGLARWVCQSISDIVRASRHPYRPDVEAYAQKNSPDDDRDIFIAMILNVIERINEGVLARDRIKPLEFKA
jgi:hypothetical protein